MERKNILKGVVFVGLGASSYGMLATFVKLAYNEGYTTDEVTFAQLSLGVLGMLLITLFQTKIRKVEMPKLRKNDLSKLLLVGTSLGFTSLFYYLSVVYINVSVAIVFDDANSLDECFVRSNFIEKLSFCPKNYFGSDCFAWNIVGNKPDWV